MKTFVRCGQLFTGNEDEARKDEVLLYDEDGGLLYVGAEAGAPRRAKADRLIDHSGHFVMPGLIDVHTHLAYGNAKSEEDIDLYSPLEFRALRGMFFAQKVAASGYTAICSPGDAGQISLSIRNAIRAGLFDGPRVMAAGPYLTTHQGLTDWYPTWIGAPETSIGKLVTNINEAVEEVRRQVKNGVDCIKIGARRHSAPPRRRADRRLHPGRDRHHRARKPPAGPQGALALGRSRGDALCGARRDRPDLPRLRSRRGMHRGDARNRQHAVPDPDAPAQPDRFHPAARAGGAKGPGRADRGPLPPRRRAG